ncbi:hypothetical protein B0H14DRAFT_3646647 [Mycena olivaceomarginata]|nr:hypothetical protein B0H14DRAFT_3646647 [Mycena olivaceomarginata]
MSSTGPPSSTWNGEEAGQLQEGKSLSPARRLIPRIIIASFFLVILAAVIVTGVLFNKSVKKTEARHSLKGLDLPPNAPIPDSNSLAVGIMMKMKNFDPGSSIISFDMQAFLGFVDSDDERDAIPVCVYVVDPEGLNTPLVLPLNYQDKSDDGSISHFPFDVYSGSLVISAWVLNNATNSSEIACNTAFDITNNNISTTSLPLYFQIGQDLDDFSAHTALQQLSENDELAPYGDASVSITISRREVVRFFAVLMFIVLIHGCESRFDIIASCTGLLFALPGLRSATPGIPTTPTVSDAVGYFWNIALLALRMGNQKKTEFLKEKVHTETFVQSTYILLLETCPSIDRDILLERSEVREGKCLGIHCFRLLGIEGITAQKLHY